MMENGISTIGGQLNVGSGNSQKPIPTAAANQVLKLAGGDNEWVGGLADLAIWGSALSPTDSTGPTGYMPATGSPPENWVPFTIRRCRASLPWQRTTPWP